MILDECLPRKFGRELVGHEVSTVAKAGFAGVKNGELLKKIDGLVDAFITVDQNLPSQQSVSRHTFGVIVLRARTNKIEDIAPLAADVLAALSALTPGTVRLVG